MTPPANRPGSGPGSPADNGPAAAPQPLPPAAHIPPPPAPPPADTTDWPEFLKRVLAATVVVVGVVLLVAFVGYTARVLLLLFAGVLLGILLRGFSELLVRLTPLSGGWALAVVCVVIFGGIAALVVLSAPSVASQLELLGDQWPRAVERARAYAVQTSAGRWLYERTPTVAQIALSLSGGEQNVTGLMSLSLGFTTNLILVVFIGIYFAAEPRSYMMGAILLVPVGQRERARALFGEVGRTLHWWLLGRLAGMLIIGTLASVGLTLLGVPLAMALGLFAGLMEFIPYLGPLIGLIPALLIGLSVSPEMALYVFLLYLALQSFESYFISPYIDRQTVLLPPVFTLMVQVVFGAILGAAGLALAVPLTAATVVLVKRLYIEEALGDPLGPPTPSATAEVTDTIRQV